MTWQTRATIGELCTVVAGGTPARSNPKHFGGTIPWIKIGDMLQGCITHTEECITELAIKNSSAKVLPVGTVIVSIFATIGRTAVLGVEAATNQAIAGLTPRNSDQLSAAYLRRYLDSVVRELESKAQGVAQVNINSSILKALKIPLPPISEQGRILGILGILDSVDALRAKRRKAIALLDDLARSIFLDMFGDPAINPHGWDTREFGTLASIFSDGPFGSNLKSSHYADSGVRVVRLQNIGIGSFVNDDRAYVSPEYFASLKRHSCLPGDVLIATLGNPNIRACIQPEWLSLALNKADCVQVRLNPKVASATYVCALLNQPSIEKMAQSMLLGQTRVRISMGRLRTLKIPVPPRQLQAVFSARIEALQTLCAPYHTHLAELDALFASLQQRAFRGELWHVPAA